MGINNSNSNSNSKVNGKMGRFARVATAQGFGKGTYLPHEDATYKVRVLEAKVIDTRENGDAFIVEFDVLESSSAAVKVGAKRSWYRNISASEKKGGENARYDMRVWLCQAFADAEEILERMESDNKKTAEAAEAEWEEFVTEVLCTDTSPAAGMIFQVTTQAGKTQGGGPFTHHTWELLEDPGAEG